MGQFLQNLAQIWRRTSLLNRLVLVAVGLGCAAAAILLVGWARTPEMSVLYSKLPPEEAAKIVEKLSDAGTPYELKDGGATVLVPHGKVYSARISLAAQGLPAAERGGYKLFDEEKLGASPFSQQMTAKRAQEGELARTIEVIDGVASAKVLIARPASSLFAQKNNEPSASVTVTLKPGTRLTPRNVASIVYIVAAGEGLSPDKVVVVDNKGNLLSGESTNELAKKAGTLLDLKSQYEQYYSQKAEDLLAAALGPGRASVRVDAVIDTASIDQTTETVDPDKRVITEEEIKTKSSQGPVAAGESAGAGKGTSTREDSTKSTYAITKIVERRMDLPGKVKSLTVAAFVDLTPPAQSGSSAPAPTVTQQDVQQIITKALGLTADDTLTVIATPFNRPEAAPVEASEGVGSQEFYLEIARRSSLGILVIGALLALKIFRKPSGKASAKAQTAGLAIADGSPALSGQPNAARMLGADAAIDPALLRSRISQALQDNPEEVKRLFLSWVESGKAEA